MDLVKRLRSGEDGLEYAAADEIERLLEILMKIEVHPKALLVIHYLARDARSAE